MEKLKFFTFNNIRFQYRKFPYSEIGRELKTGDLLPGWMESFARGMFDTPDDCKKNLCGMIGVTADDTANPEAVEWWKSVNVWLTEDYYVDTSGIAWPDGSFSVWPNFPAGSVWYPPTDPVCILVAPKSKFS